MMRKLIFSLMILIATIGCKNPSETDTILKSDEKMLKQIEAELQAEDSTKKANELHRVENEKRFKILKNSFTYKEDEFEKIGWYIHKNQTTANSWNRKYLKANVNSEGYIYLEDQYYSDDWIFHNRIEVKIGDSVYKSETVETYNEDNKTDNSGESIWENISYTGKKDNGIIKAIAESEDKIVKVRFIGKYTSDFTLSKRDKSAIKDSYELSILIKNLTL